MDHLSNLPPEILHLILSYLLRPLSYHPSLTGYPRTEILLHHYANLPIDKSARTKHTYYNLAATCHALRAGVEQYCAHLMRSYPEVRGTIPEPGEESQFWEKAGGKEKGKGRKPGKLCWRATWIRSTWRRCMFCPRETQAFGLFDKLLWCCSGCNLRVYGNPVSMTNVKRRFKLKPIVYRDPQAVFPGSGLRPLRVGMVATGNMISTYYMRKEAEAMRDYIKVHDAEGHKVQKAWKRDLDREDRERRGIVNEDRLSSRGKLIKASCEEVETSEWPGWEGVRFGKDTWRYHVATFQNPQLSNVVPLSPTDTTVHEGAPAIRKRVYDLISQ